MSDPKDPIVTPDALDRLGAELVARLDDGLSRLDMQVRLLKQQRDTVQALLAAHRWLRATEFQASVQFDPPPTTPPAPQPKAEPMVKCPKCGEACYVEQDVTLAAHSLWPSQPDQRCPGSGLPAPQEESPHAGERQASSQS